MFEVFNFFKFKDDYRASSSGFGCALDNRVESAFLIVCRGYLVTIYDHDRKLCHSLKRVLKLKT